jgi:hypothetical protein
VCDSYSEFALIVDINLNFLIKKMNSRLRQNHGMNQPSPYQTYSATGMVKLGTVNTVELRIEKHESRPENYEEGKAIRQCSWV